MLCLFIVTRRIPHQPRLAERHEPAIPPLPDQQTFRQYLRELALGAIRVVVKDVMREELDAHIGVGWGERSRQQQRLPQWPLPPRSATSSGRLEDLKVPRDLEGHFHTQVFDRYSRYEPHIAEGLDGDVRGWSEQPTSVGEVAQTLLGVAPSGSRDQSAQPNADPAI